MSEETRRSPWLPVNEPAVAQDASPSFHAPAQNVPQPQTSPPPNPMETPAAPTRRASLMSPYLVTRADSTEAPAEPTYAPMFDASADSGERNAYSPAPTPVDPANAWEADPAHAPLPPVGLAPALANPPYGAPAARPAAPGPTHRGRVPSPVEAEDVEVIRPVMPPPASEILPTTGTLPVLEPPDEEYDLLRQAQHTPIGPESDPFFALGVSAVASASLSAAGARVPGPTDWEGEQTVPSFGDATPFVPQFSPESEPEPEPEPFPQPAVQPVRAPMAFSPLAAQDPARQPIGAPAAPWTPVAVAMASNPGTELTTRAHGGVPTPPAYDDDSDSTPWWRKLWFLIAVGVLVVVGLGFLTYRLFLMPEPIILPVPVVTEAPPGPSIDPVELTEPSELLTAMPREVSTFAMTSYVSLDVLGDESIPARAAEHLVLTYGETTAADTFTINAYQFFNSTEAQIAFDTWLEGQSDLEDVTVDGTVVGERGMLPGGAGDTIVWRNETMVFVMEGPPDELLEFYSYFGF